MVKINRTVTAPFKYARYVPGPLFPLTIEPFLLVCSNTLQDYGLPVQSSIDRSLATSAYVGDITVLVTKDEGFPHLLQNFVVYGALSGATLNVQKSAGLFVGQWKSRTHHPLGFQWSEQGGKYLGNKTAW
jgi:hypothetical protein